MNFSLPLDWFDGTNPNAPFNWYNSIGATGCVLWMFAYGISVRRSFRDKISAFPFLAVCLNISWEAVAFLSPCPVVLWRWIELVWCLIDGVLFYQLVRFGDDRFLLGSWRRRLVVAIAVTLYAAALHVGWGLFWDDPIYFVDAYLINLVMSGLFVGLAMSRPDNRGLPMSSAILKMVGSVFTGIQAVFYLPQVMHFPRQSWLFFGVVWFGIFALDIVYIYLLYSNERQKSLALK